MFHGSVISNLLNKEIMKPWGVQSTGTPCRRPLILKSKEILLIVLKYIGILAQYSNFVFDHKNYVTVLYHDGKPI